MIRLQDLTPSVYYTKSRDFQFIGRLYDLVLNYVKTNADNIYTLPIHDNMNEQLLNLLAFTLGFQSRHNYNGTQLYAICSVLPLILKNKGSLNAIIIAVNALLHAEGIKQALDYSIDNGKSITLYLPQQLTDLNLLRDLLVYILPAGISCSMIKEIQEISKIKTEISTSDTVIYTVENSYDVDSQQILQPINRQTGKPTAETDRYFSHPSTNLGVIQNISMPEVSSEEDDNND